jgi:hypothetical protein
MNKMIYKITLLFMLIYSGIISAQEYRFSNYSFSGYTTVQSATSDIKINATIGSPISGVSQSNGFIIHGKSNSCCFLINNEVSGITEAKDIPTRYCLYQNYPNPFNPKTNIKYSIPKEGIVTISVYNMIGQKVSVIVNEKKSPGIYEVIWDASRLSSGVYIYYLISGSFSNSKKLILLK